MAGRLPARGWDAGPDRHGKIFVDRSPVPDGLMIFWNRNTINKHRRASTSDNPWNSAKNAAPARAMLILGQLT